MNVWLSRIGAVIIGLIVSMLIGMVYLYLPLLLIRYLLKKRNKSIYRFFNKEIVIYLWIIVLIVMISVFISYLINIDIILTISTSIYTAIIAIATCWTAVFYTIKKYRERSS